MGQIADDHRNGFCCDYCGIYFLKKHGHPVLCGYCFDELTKKERTGRPRATHKEMDEATEEELIAHGFVETTGESEAADGRE